MTAAVLMAGAAGALGVLAAWEALAAIDQRLAARALGRWLAPLRRDGEPSSAERRRLAAVAAAALCAGGWLLLGPLAALILGAAGPWAANRALAARRARRRARLAAAAPAVARAVADALTAGHSVRGALGAAATTGGLDGPAAAELSAASAALDAGASTDDVLDRLRRRARDPGWDTLVAAILLQRDAGGDLALLLRGLAERVEEAQRANADARSATAQARFTAWLVASLPAGAAVLAELGSPGYLASLAREPLTGALLAASLTLQLLAVVAIRRIARTP
ncbi:MAG TPA: type II secretion system F family protein [Solirubrobacteraceae bacterium]